MADSTLSNLTDVGVNMHSKQFNNKHEQVMESARSAGVTHIIGISNSLKECNFNIKLCKQFSDVPKMVCTVGVHPHSAKQLNSRNFNVLKQTIERNRDVVVAVGECGLDYNRMFSPKEAQRKWFEEQIKLAIELDLPLYFHERDAHKDFVEITSKYAGKIRGIVHCFTGSKEQLQAYLDLGFYVGITGWVCDERRGKALQNAVPSIPKDRILLETDSPWLTPRNIRPLPKYNEPKHLVTVAKTVAGLMGMDPQELIDCANQNRQRLFGF